MKDSIKKSAKLILTIQILFLAVNVFAGCEGKKYKLPVKNLEITTASGEIFTVKAEIAAKEEERNWGFMERKNIPDGTGMLFVFERDQVLSFWMKNTPTPLSIAYLDKSGKIIDIFDMTPYSLSPIVSSRSVRYALEVPKGWYKKNGIAAGDVVILTH